MKTFLVDGWFKLERLGKFLEEWFGVNTPLLRVTSSH